MSANFRSLVGKLNKTTRNAVDGALALCLSRLNYSAEVDHYLMRLLDETDTDMQKILRHFGVNSDRMGAEFTRSLDKLKRGNTGRPSLSSKVVSMLESAWLVASLDYGSALIRTGHTIIALLSDAEMAREIGDVSKEFQKIQVEGLKKDFASIVEGSVEEGQTPTMAEAAAAAGQPGGAPKIGGKTPNLDQFTVNLTDNAKKGKIDPVLGRDFEIRQIIDILTRGRQNNPILTGEAGVGKTAVVEGFALRVAQGDVPPPLKNVHVRTLDLALLQAGAGVKGEFENRLKGLIEEVKASATPIILFIDEAHTMIGAGGQAGQNDAANLLKPALARGELRTIAATTWSEYKKYFEKDAALARRFQVVKVEEPSEYQCMIMMRGLVASLEKHHNVRILDEAVYASVRLSHRFLAGRQLPDKAVSILDTACARLSLGQNAIPPAIEDAMRTIDDLAVQARVLERESALGADHSERLGQIAQERADTEGRLTLLRVRWEKERDLVTRIREVRSQLESAGAPAQPVSGDGQAAAVQPAVDLAPMRQELANLNGELEAVQGETPLIRVCVDSQIVGDVISAWTGIPVGTMLKDEIATVMALDNQLGQRVIGQSHALAGISERIRTARASLEDPNKPVGVFMLVGPSGVGKTETALALSDLLYGGERNLITINMSEFQEPHTVSTLKGSPPGYVGYGEGGVLTEAVRRRPYSVVLLDEVEKAHPDVLELFFQVFDKGSMEDGEGRQIDFKNNIIILTTNACTDQIMKLCADPETAPSSKGMVEALKPELNKVFPPAFLGRMVIVPYYPVRDEALRKIVTLKLRKIQRRIQENHRVTLTYDDAFVEQVASRCTEVESGARNVDNILTNSLLPDISRQLLGAMAAGERMSAIHIGVAHDGSVTY